MTDRTYTVHLDQARAARLDRISETRKADLGDLIAEAIDTWLEMTENAAGELALTRARWRRFEKDDWSIEHDEVRRWAAALAGPEGKNG